MINETNYHEKIVYDNVKDEFFIERSWAGKEETQQFPLSAWNLTKEATGKILVFRDMESVDFEQPRKRLWYSVDISYKIEGKNSKAFYLKSEIIKDISDKKKKTLKIFIRNVNEGITMQVPIPNEIYNDDYNFLTVEKSKAVRLKNQVEINEILASGQCLGIFTFDLKNQLP